MKNDKIKYLRGSKELLGLAGKDYEDLLFEQSLSGFSKPVKFKNRNRKSWFENEDEQLKRPKFSAIKKWSDKN